MPDNNAPTIDLTDAWSHAYRAFDEHPLLKTMADHQAIFVIVCVGARRSSVWAGNDWAYAEHHAKHYDTRTEAAKALRMLPLAPYCRLVRQPRPEWQKAFPVLWPSFNGWMCDMPDNNDHLGPA
jgi:hypothetical protein